MARGVLVEKRKWDDSLSASERGRLVVVSGRMVAWLVVAGTERQRPAKGTTEMVETDELWTAVPGQWWVLCARAGQGETIDEFILHAAAPFRRVQEGVIRWIDLDLDFEVRGGDIEMEDEAQFHRHARTMSYPDHVVRGAWSGISRLAPRYTTGEWPFDGWLERCLALGRGRLALEQLAPTVPRAPS
jgi:protein associated with RNAse G/E